jgi:hypothetical protein
MAATSNIATGSLAFSLIDLTSFPYTSDSALVAVISVGSLV